MSMCWDSIYASSCSIWNVFFLTFLFYSVKTFVKLHFQADKLWVFVYLLFVCLQISTIAGIGIAVVEQQFQFGFQITSLGMEMRVLTWATLPAMTEQRSCPCGSKWQNYKVLVWLAFTPTQWPLVAITPCFWE